MKTSRLFPVIAIALTCLQVWAGDGPLPVVNKSIQLVEAEGQPSQLVFSDGRVATLKVSKMTSKSVAIPLELTENSCFPQVRAPRCTYNFNFTVQSANYIWTKNPDAKKIGKNLTLNYSGYPPSAIEAENIIYNNYSRIALPSIPNNSQTDSIVCDHMNWLPESTDKTTTSIKVWAGEVMFLNQETGVNENQTVMSYSNMIWSRHENTLTLKSINRISSTFLAPPLTSASLMIVEDKNQECQISAGSDFKALQSTFSLPPQPITDLAPAYLRLKHLSDLSFQLNYILKNNYGEVVQ